MATTIDGYALHVDSLSEGYEIRKTEWDAWESGAYKRKLEPYGHFKRWSVSCWEKNVAWANSVAKYLEEKAAAGTTVTLVIDITGMFTGADRLHSVASTTCKIIGIGVTYAKADGDYREFVVELQAVV